MVRTMLIHSHLPQSFWSEALQHAAYIKNCLLHSAISYDTPFSLWHDQLITPIGHIRPFGCIVYAEIPKERRPNLQNISHEYTKAVYFNKYLLQ